MTNEKLTLGEKLAGARKSAGLTQRELAEKLTVSRQAVAKWESNGGMPDIENLRRLSKLLNVSIDYLLDDGKTLDFSVMREGIDLDKYVNSGTNSKRRYTKSDKKYIAVLERHRDAEILPLLGEQIPTKSERIIDNAIGFLTNAPFGIPSFINGVKNADKKFYLVNDGDKQFLVTVTDEFIESRRLSEKITAKKFTVGNFVFRVAPKKSLSPAKR